MNTVARGVVQQNISLSQYTSWRVGGPAQKLYLPLNINDLSAFLPTIAPNEPIFFMGLGSNLLVRDGGIPGATIVTQGGLNQIALLEDNLVKVEAGAACAQMARFCARNNLSAEFLAGIPGTIGGALLMNAGCYGSETWEYIEKVETVDRQGKHHIRSANEYQVSYRAIKPPLPDEWFAAGYFRLPYSRKENALEKIRQLLDRRAETQPTSEPNCGSVFRNPPNDHAGRLIEACGLKGFTIGGAAVSEKHANFITNLGNATAHDIEKLIYHVKLSVKEALGVELVQEVHVVGLSL
jgi:UDP-N-acetylmuramate dehydrogenase